MHRVALQIGCVPTNEPFARAGATPDWLWLQALEAETYRAALIARYGLPPDGLELAVRTLDRTAGVGTGIEARFDADDAGCIAYYDKVFEGLDNWSDAKFTAPVQYDADGIERPGTRRETADCIVEAVMAAYQALGRGDPGGIGRIVADNLTDTYETLAEEAIAKLFALALGEPYAA